MRYRGCVREADGGVLCVPVYRGVFEQADLGEEDGVCGGGGVFDGGAGGGHAARVPGNDFGFPDHVRLSFAMSMENIDKGVDRLEKFLKG